MITKEILLSSGYKRFQPNPTLSPYATDSYQKLVSNEKGKKYFINFDYLPADDVIPEAFEASLYTEHSITDCSVSFKIWNTANATLEQIEELLERLWSAAGSNYYEKSENYYVKCDLCSSEDCDGHYGEGFQ